MDQRFTHARILELVATGIHEPALRTRRRLIGQHLALDAAILDGREVVARRPYPRGKFFAVQVALSAKSLEGDIAVAVEFVTNGIEIINAAADRQIGTPPVLDPIVFDIAVGLEFADLVRPRPQRYIEGGFVERPRRVIGLRENRQAGN